MVRDVPFPLFLLILGKVEHVNFFSAFLYRDFQPKSFLLIHRNLSLGNM